MITLQQWRDCEGQSFTLPDGNTLVLESVSMPVAPDGWECFSLLFAAPCELEQGMRILRHPTLGEEAVFLVPLGPFGATDGAQRFEAVFNRRVANP